MKQLARGFDRLIARLITFVFCALMGRFLGANIAEFEIEHGSDVEVPCVREVCDPGYSSGIEVTYVKDEQCKCVERYNHR